MAAATVAELWYPCITCFVSQLSIMQDRPHRRSDLVPFCGAAGGAATAFNCLVDITTIIENIYYYRAV